MQNYHTTIQLSNQFAVLSNQQALNDSHGTNMENPIEVQGDVFRANNEEEMQKLKNQEEKNKNKQKENQSSHKPTPTNITNNKSTINDNTIEIEKSKKTKPN